MPTRPRKTIAPAMGRGFGADDEREGTFSMDEIVRYVIHPGVGIARVGNAP